MAPVTFTPNLSHVVFAANGTHVVVQDLNHKDLCHTIRLDMPARCIAMSPDADIIVILEGNHNVPCFYDLKQACLVPSTSMKFTYWMYKVDRMLWQAPCDGCLANNGSPVDCIAFSPDGVYAAISCNSVCQIIDLTRNQMHTTFTTDADITSMCFDAKNTIHVGMKNGLVTTMHLQTGDQFTKRYFGQTTATYVCVNPVHNYLAVAGDQWICCFNSNGMITINTLPKDVTGLAWNEAKNQMWYCTSDLEVRQFNVSHKGYDFSIVKKLGLQMSE